jgi:hypothetical protein
MNRLVPTVLTLAIASSLQAAEPTFRFDPARATPTGTLLHFTKSNRDGSEPWHFEVYYQSPTRIDVIKWVEGASDFVEVMADLDPARGMPIAVQQWNTANGRREPRLATVAAFTGTGSQLAVQLADGGRFDLKATTHAPFNFWGFDLAGLGVMLPHLAQPDQPFEVWFADPNRPNADGSPILVERATFEPVGEETIDGVVTRKYRLAGPFFGDQVGTVWIGKDNGRIERAEHPVPTSTDWNDWKLEFERAERMDSIAWEQFKLKLADAQRAGKPAASAAGAMKKAYDANGIAAAFQAVTDYRQSIDDALEGDYNTFGYALLGFGKHEDALRVFEHAVKQWPKSANAWDSLGEAQAEAGQRERAIASYRQALKLDPKHAHAAEQIQALSAK